VLGNHHFGSDLLRADLPANIFEVKCHCEERLARRGNLTRRMKNMQNQTKLEFDTVETRSRLMAELSSHAGKMNAIGMAELYQAVFDRPWQNRINDTRALRHLITELRDEGEPICSTSSSDSGGYYLAAAGDELIDFLRKDKFRALRIHRRDAKILKISLPDYLGQLKLELESGNEAA
jgi:hypothetical protein